MKNQYFSMVCIESFITFLPIIINYKTFSQNTINFGIGPIFNLPGLKKGHKNRKRTLISAPGYLCSSCAIEPQVLILNHVFHIYVENSCFNRQWHSKTNMDVGLFLTHMKVINKKKRRTQIYPGPGIKGLFLFLCPFFRPGRSKIGPIPKFIVFCEKVL